MKPILFVFAIFVSILLTNASRAQGQSTAFTYQGRLNDGTNAANGAYDLRFILFNMDQFGFPVGPILTNQDVAISGGLFAESAGIRHLGPVAQDFKAAFELGVDDKHIATVDADGVALAAIQGLNQKVEEKNAKISALEKRLAELETLVLTLAGRK